ncbi:uncharacterized protein LOC129599027 [Paramacrobiotus metropolitanus]|uniref:uncharacterized protein LOC129599027 n=1 Tax=Paramacrobiotus metropolitanus TaxID=2943436 RepID=UPI0024461E40|nr:uncharacterized protein LOC129599027 [Paramacrobiotus metropolitanus]
MLSGVSGETYRGGILGPLAWPLTDAEVYASQQLARDYCRSANDCAHCLLNLTVRCAHDPTFLQHLQQNSVPYNAEITGVMATMCQLSVDPLRFVRAIEHCEEQRPEFVLEVLHEDRSVLAANSHDAISARRNVCKKLHGIATGLDEEEAKAELTKKCGLEAVKAMHDTYQRPNDIHCTMTNAAFPAMRWQLPYFALLTALILFKPIAREHNTVVARTSCTTELVYGKNVHPIYTL